MPPPSGNCVLLGDDHPSGRNLLGRYLEKAAFAAFQAEAGIDPVARTLTASVDFRPGNPRKDKSYGA